MNVTANNMLIDSIRQHSAGKLSLRCQADSDISALNQLGPRDQRLYFVGSWSEDGNTFSLERIELVDCPGIIDADAGARPVQTDPTYLMLAQMNDPDLITAAGEAGVEWDATVSRSTMLERITDGINAAKQQPPSVEPPPHQAE